MSRRPALFTALLSFLLLTGFTPQPLQPQWDDQKYYNCRDTTDCIALNPPCSNLRGYNRAFATEIQAWFDYDKTFRGPCPGWPQNGAQVVLCSTAKKCIMASAGLNVPAKTDRRYCDLDEDCAVVEGKCGRPVVVNRKYAAEEQADPASFATCSHLDDRSAKSVRCKDHLCKAEFVKRRYSEEESAEDTLQAIAAENGEVGDDTAPPAPQE